MSPFSDNNLDFKKSTRTEQAYCSTSILYYPFFQPSFQRSHVFIPVLIHKIIGIADFDKDDS